MGGIKRATGRDSDYHQCGQELYLGGTLHYI